MISKKYEGKYRELLEEDIPKVENDLISEVDLFNMGGTDSGEEKLDDLVNKFCSTLDKTMQDIDIKMEKIHADIGKFKVHLARRFPEGFRDKAMRYLDTVADKATDAKRVWKRESNLRSDRVKKYWDEENGRS